MNGQRTLYDNSLRLPIDDTEQWILSGIGEKLLTPDVLEYVEKQVHERLTRFRQQQTVKDTETQELRARLTEIGMELAMLPTQSPRWEYRTLWPGN